MLNLTELFTDMNTSGLGKILCTSLYSGVFREHTGNGQLEKGGPSSEWNKENGIYQNGQDLQTYLS